MKIVIRFFILIGVITTIMSWFSQIGHGIILVMIGCFLAIINFFIQRKKGKSTKKELITAIIILLGLIIFNYIFILPLIKTGEIYHTCGTEMGCWDIHKKVTIPEWIMNQI